MIAVGCVIGVVVLLRVVPSQSDSRSSEKTSKPRAEDRDDDDSNRKKPSKPDRQAPDTTTAFDPSTCPKGRVSVVDGKFITCTGAGTAAPTAATDSKSDDDDVNDRCKAVRQVWKELDGLDPVIKCGVSGDAHGGVVVITTQSGWEYLGEHEKQLEFAKSFLEAFKPHWKQFHAWTGADPDHHVVSIWSPSSTGSTDIKMDAAIDSAEKYSEGP